MTRLASSHYILGSKKESLYDLCKKNPSWDYEKLLSKTGIKNRHILSEAETPEFLSEIASKECLKKYKKKVDGIIFVTQSPSIPLPTRACLLQDKLQLTKNTIAFDINQGCSGFVYATSLACALINSKQAKRILVVCADHYSKYISINDRTSRPIFSDAAAAIVIEESKTNEIGPFIFKTDGSGSKFLTVIKENRDQKLFMNGPEVLKFTLNLVPETVNELLKKANLSMQDIDLFIFHQASAVVLNKLKKKLNIPNNKWTNEIENIGNTVSATIPIAINNLQKDNTFYKKKNILMMGFGVGLSVAGCIIQNKN